MTDPASLGLDEDVQTSGPRKADEILARAPPRVSSRSFEGFLSHSRRVPDLPALSSFPRATMDVSTRSDMS